jgi:hypothetical protein
MLDGNGFYPPVQYSALWLILGIVILVIIIGWYVFVLVFNRRRAQPYASDPLPGIPHQGTALRDTYLTLVDDIARAHAAGELDFREAHQRLSLVVREFAAQARGVRAQYMTLEDLRATPLAPLTATVGEIYPGAFSGDETGSFAAAADRARMLVREWK